MELTEQEKKKIEAEERYRHEVRHVYTSSSDLSTKKSKIVAGLLAIFLGGIGIHKFYLGRPIQGIIYFIFCWTFIPAFIGFVEGIIYLCMSDSSFAAKYK